MVFFNKSVLFVAAFFVAAATLSATGAQAQSVPNSITLDQGSGYDAYITQAGSSNAIVLKQVNSGNSEPNGVKPTAIITQNGMNNEINATQQSSFGGSKFTVTQNGSNNVIRAEDFGHQTGGQTQIIQSGNDNTIDAVAGSFRESAYINQAGSNNSINARGSFNVVQTATSLNNSIISDYSLSALQEGNNQSIISTSGNHGSFGGNTIKQFAKATDAFAEAKTEGLGSATIEQYGEGAEAYAETGAYGQTTIIQKGKDNAANVANPGSSIVSVTQELGSDGSIATIKAKGARTEVSLLQDGVENVANISTAGSFNKTNAMQFNGRNVLNASNQSSGGVLNVTQRGGSTANITMH